MTIKEIEEKKGMDDSCYGHGHGLGHSHGHPHGDDKKIHENEHKYDEYLNEDL